MKRIKRLIRLWMSSLSLLLCALALSACASLTPPLPERPPIPADLMMLCPDLTPLQGNKSSDVAKKLAEISQQYYTCADRHAGLVQAVQP